MTQNKVTIKQKAKVFFKRNLYPIIVSASAFTLAIALIVTALVRNKIIKEQEEAKMNQEYQQNANNPSVEAASPGVVVFEFPLKEYTLGSTFADSSLVYNETLKEYSTHLGVDFIASDGAEVYPCYNGRVESVEYNTLDGTVVVIDHGNALKSIYKSLAQDAKVVVGQEVTTSDVIGNVSNSSSSEASLGSHVHLEVTLDGVPVNPMNYLGYK